MFRNAKRLVYLAGIYSIGSIFEKALAFFFIPIYTTYLGTSDYGIVGLMSVTVGLLSRFVEPPITNGLVRHYYAPEYKNKRGVLLFNSFLFLTLQVWLLAVIFYFFNHIISTIVLASGDLVYIVKIYAFILFFDPLSNLLLTFLRQEEKANFFIFISWLRFLISAGVILFGLILFKIGILALIYGNLVGVIFTVACILPVFWKYCTPKIDRFVLGPPLRFGYPLIVQGFSSLFIQSGDRYVLRIFTSVSNVGLYSFGYSFAGILNVLLITPLKYALQPIVLKQEEEPEKLKTFLRNNCTYFYLIGTFLFLLLSLYSKEAIEIMARNKDFWESWIIVPIIAFCYLQHGLGNFLNWGLGMAKKAFHISGNVLIAAVINIGLNFVFVPFFGILGAALATLISYIVWNCLKIYYSAKFYELYFDLRRLGHISIVGCGLFLVSLFIANNDSLPLNIAIKWLILLAYPAVIFVTGFFTSNERKYMRKLWRSTRVNGFRETYAKIKAI